MLEGGPFADIETFSEKISQTRKKHWKISQIISERRYIRNLVCPVCVNSGMGCVVVEGDSLALFTSLKMLQGTLYPVGKHTLQLIKVIKLSFRWS